MIIQMVIPSNVKALMHRLLDKGYEAYIVGGACRAVIMRETPKDYDIFTNCLNLIEVFPEGNIIGGVERQAKILTIIVDGVEVSSYRANGNRTETGKNFVTHLSTCDFTCNSIYCGIDGILHDPYNGIIDIHNKELRFVGDPIDRVMEDSLRLFRGIRFAAKYNLDIVDESVFSDFDKYVSALPLERVREEFLKILMIPNGLKLLNDYGMLGWIIPEWYSVEYLHGGLHHDETVGEHILDAVNTCLGYTNNVLIATGVFWHDLGKDKSKGFDDDNNITFYEHQIIGAVLCRDWMLKFKFSHDDIKFVTTIVRHHMMGKTGSISNNQFVTICSELDSASVDPLDMLVVTFSDNQANRKNPRLTYNEFLKNNGFLQRYYELKYSLKGFTDNALEINGRDIIALGIIVGPEIGRIKREVFNAVLEGKVINRRDRLLEYIKQYEKVKL